MIYITGDTHADFTRFAAGRFPQQAEMSKEDYVIICGDFGGVWSDDPAQQSELDRINELPFTTLFITGNHENYDLLATYPIKEWHGGIVQFIRPSIIHLMRGQVYEIDGQSFFTMGGAACHDIYNGVLDLDDPKFEQKYRKMRYARKFFRINHLSWWKQELPEQEELDEGRKNLTAHDNRVDYVLSHCAPTQLQRKIQAYIGDDTHPENTLTEFLQWVYTECQFKHWYCGHYHEHIDVEPNFHVLYKGIIPLGNAACDYSLDTE